MRWPRNVLALVGAGSLSACALVSGLDRLDVGGGTDASVSVDASDGSIPTIPDASDASIAFDAGDPTQLRCGPNAVCRVGQQTCCRNNGFACVDKNGCTDGGALTCDFGGQCPPGSICCLQTSQNVLFTTACRAASECEGGTSLQLCRGDSECLKGACNPVPGVSWLSYCK